MAKRRKNRTHLKGTVADAKGNESIPKSFIIKHGYVGSSVTQLVRDLRQVMEPNTASRLKVNKCLPWLKYMSITPFRSGKKTN